MKLQIIDPDNGAACNSYALYRRGLKSATRMQHYWTPDEVRRQVLATVLKASLTAVREPMLDISIYVSGYWSVLRVDLSPKYAIVTREDPEGPGMRVDAGTTFYETYVNDLHFSALQCRALPTLPDSANPYLSDATSIRDVLLQLGIRHDDLTDDFLVEVGDLIKGSSHQYE